MWIALDDLGPAHLWIIYPGLHAYPAHEKVTVLPLRDVSDLSGHISQRTDALFHTCKTSDQRGKGKEIKDLVFSKPVQ
jgi:hypothetical protein